MKDGKRRRDGCEPRENGSKYVERLALLRAKEETLET
jgi:hypothetical protein